MAPGPGGNSRLSSHRWNGRRCRSTAQSDRVTLRQPPSAYACLRLGQDIARPVPSTMSYIDSNLLDGEHVVFRTRLHWRLFMGPVLLIVIVLLPGAWFLASSTWSGYAWIPMALAALVLVTTFIKRQSSDFAVTNK